MVYLYDASTLAWRSEAENKADCVADTSSLHTDHVLVQTRFTWVVCSKGLAGHDAASSVAPFGFLQLEFG